MTDVSQEDARYVWHPYTPLVVKKNYPEVVSASGMYMHLADGTTLLDGISSWWVNIHGHANPLLADTLRNQVLTLDHTLFAGFTHRPAVEFAKAFLRILKCSQQRIFYSENGSTAVEVAMKMAVQYWKNKGEIRTSFIAFEGAFHGDTFGAMSVSGRGLFTGAFESMLYDVLFLPLPTGENQTEILSMIDAHLKTHAVAAFIYEPLVQGSGGMNIYEPALLQNIIEHLQQQGIICIADEVLTGFGRTGKDFASHYMSADPDIMCFSKAITGGILPLGVTSCNEKIEAVFRTDEFSKTFFHGHSYTANPIICQLALTSLSLFDTDTCRANIQRISENHKRFIRKNASRSAVKRMQSLGTILAIEIHTENGISSYEHEIRYYLYDFFIKRGILLRPLGNVIYFMPPYIIENQEMEMVYKALEEMLESFEK